MGLNYESPRIISIAARFVAYSTLAVFEVISQSTAQAAAPDCVAKPLAPAPASIRTSGSVETRAGRRIFFQADAGWIRVRLEGATKGRPDQDPALPSAHGLSEVRTPTALMSYVAYFADGAPAAARPIMFVWDGGPGSSTRPMLLGSFGPVVGAAPALGGATAVHVGPPVRPNPDTLLDAADLVFVDAPGTGFGRIEGCAGDHSFYGIDADAAAFQQFISRFLVAYHRQASPLFLFGESYGTLRAAVVAHRLEDAGKPVAGVVLLSQYLALDGDPDGAQGNPGTENPYFLMLPTLAATAWTHGRVARTGDFEAWLREVERFSIDVYAPALLQGSDLPLDRKQALAAQLAGYTGLSPQAWLDADLRMDASRFSKLLEADQGKIVGREDTRLDGPAPKVRGTAVENDPTLKLWQAVQLAAFRSYMRGTLKLGDRPFVSGIVVHWDMRHKTDPNIWDPVYVNVGPDLVDAMKKNPKLQVFVAGGYFDLSTPYFGMEYLIKHLGLTVHLMSNIFWHAYPAGHSAYDVDTVRIDMHDRIAGLISAAASYHHASQPPAAR